MIWLAPSSLARPDLDQSDLIFTQLGLSAIMDATRGIAPDLYRRYLTIFLDGIRANRAEISPLPHQLSAPLRPTTR